MDKQQQIEALELQIKILQDALGKVHLGTVELTTYGGMMERPAVELPRQPGDNFVRLEAGKTMCYRLALTWEFL